MRKLIPLLLFGLLLGQTDLTNQSPADTYDQLLHIPNANGRVFDGDGDSLSVIITTDSTIIDATSTEAFLVRKDADGGDVFVVDTDNERVGIGDSSPDYKLDVAGTLGVDGNATFEEHLQIGDGSGKKLKIGTALALYNAGGSNLWSDDLQILHFNHANSKIQVAGTGDNYFMGNVGIGTTSPDQVLHLSAAGDIRLRIENSSFGQEWDHRVDNSGQYVFSDVTNSLNPIVIEPNAATNMLYLDSSGNVGIAMTNPSVELDVTGDIEYTGTITDVSDIRLKENIVPLENALDNVNTLNAFTFTDLSDITQRVNIGLSAQDVQAVYPMAVSEIDTAGHLGLSYVQMIPVLVKAVQELSAQNEELKARIEALEE